MSESRRPRSRPRYLCLIGLVLAGLGGSALAAGGGQPPAPPGSVYQPPHPLPRRPAGTLIWAQRVPLPLNPPATLWRILYHSRDLRGRDIAVSGFAIIPNAATKNGVRPVYAWAHGSAGQADRCAPSRHLRQNLPPYGGELIGRGMALVATDYQGLGTPGIPTYNVGVPEGRAVLDSVRAITRLPGVGRIGPVLLAGHSQGGGAALWAGELAPTYAPGLDVRGVVALAPAAQFTTIARKLADKPFKNVLGEVLWVISGLKAAYGSRLHFSGVLTKTARDDLPRVAHQCAEKTIADWRGKSIRAVFTRPPLSVSWLVKLLRQNSAGQKNPGVPILLDQGTKDEQIPLAVSRQLEARYCRLGATITRNLYPGADHEGVVDAAANDVLAWIGDRLDRKPATSDC